MSLPRLKPRRPWHDVRSSPLETLVRIGQFIQNVGVQGGGTSTAFLNTLAALRTQGEIVPRAFAFRPAPGDPADVDIRAHAEQWSVVDPSTSDMQSGALGGIAGAAIARGDIHVAHLHGLWSPDLLSIARACGRHGIPYIWEPHGMLAKEAYAQKRWKKEIFMAMGLRRALRRAAALSFVTADERSQSIIPSGIPLQKQVVVPLPVMLPPMPITVAFRADARQRFGVPQNAPSVVFMGRFHHVKRIDMAMRAMASHPRLARDGHLLIVGGGTPDEEAALRALADQLKLGERAIFAGWVQGDDKWRALAAADALTLNSVHENFGYVAVEALCVGTMPVLTSNLALAREIQAANAGLVCEPTDAALGEALNRACTDADWKRTLETGGDWVKRTLSPEAVGRQLADLYSHCLAAR